MQLLLYIFLYPILWLLSLLPFPIIYFLSDCICFVVYRIFGYRKKTVRENLSIALPHLSDKERLKVEQKFYHHLCDIFFEMIKTLTISRTEIEKRFKVNNLEEYIEIEKQGKSIALMIGHYASYEWAISMNLHIGYKGFGIYKKISNKYFDKLVRDIRSKFKSYLITTKETKAVMEQNFKTNTMAIYGFASDQTPRWTEGMHWAKFMRIETPIHTGAEFFGKKYNFNMAYIKINKVKRGFYEAEIELLNKNDINSYPDFELSELFISKIEKEIYNKPEHYLWTHKRWKHKKID